MVEPYFQGMPSQILNSQTIRRLQLAFSHLSETKFSSFTKMIQMEGIYITPTSQIKRHRKSRERNCFLKTTTKFEFQMLKFLLMSYFKQYPQKPQRSREKNCFPKTTGNFEFQMLKLLLMLKIKCSVISCSQGILYEYDIKSNYKPYNQLFAFNEYNYK